MEFLLTIPKFLKKTLIFSEKEAFLQNVTSIIFLWRKFATCHRGAGSSAKIFTLA
jgi:hypothetical protein